MRETGEGVKLPGTVLYEGLRRTAFAATDDTKRFTINGTLLLIENSRLVMVSTDGHRLCYFRIGIADAGAERANGFRCLIPIKAVRELTKILAEEVRANGKAEVRIRKGSHIEFGIGNKLMTAREVTGEFPNWEMVLPKSFDCFAELKAQDLRDALTRVGVMADDSHRRVDLTFFQNKLILKSESIDTGNSAEEINCTFQKLNNSSAGPGDSSEGWRIAFNTKYLAEFLAVQNVKNGESRVIWKFGSNVSQSLLTFEGEERLFSYVLVPLK